MDYVRIIADYGYAAVFAGSFIDHFGLPVYAMIGAGLAANPEFNLSPVLIFFYSLAGGLASDFIYYFAAKKIPEQYFNNRLNKIRFQAFFNHIRFLLINKTFIIIAFGRFIAIAGRLIAPLAGLYKIPFKKFFLSTVIGNIIYFIIYIYASFIVGRNIIDGIQKAKIWQFVAGLLILVVVFFITNKISGKYKSR